MMAVIRSDIAVTSADTLWVLVAAGLVFLMQGGFCCLESGMVRAKNSINVAAKNLLDFCVAGCLFWSVGFGLMHGRSWTGFIGTDLFLLERIGGWEMTYFLFQLVFCGTAVTIISGAVAERTRLVGYLWIAVFTSILIYPFIGHWIWNVDESGASIGWLGARGFVDFAGSTVVHSTGGWVALAAVLFIGPRMGRYDDEGHPMQGHNVPLAALGVILLWFGWYGFNGGSVLRMDSETVPTILVNTTLAAVMGGLSAAIISWTFRDIISVPLLMNGILTGLVAITASCHAITPRDAVVIGLISGPVCAGGMALMARYRIDDVVGAVPVHLGGGILGTLCVALFADPNRLNTGLTLGRQLGIQSLGILACGLWAFGIACLMLWIGRKIVPLRADPKDEHRGLNVSEHEATTELRDLLEEMETQRTRGDFSAHVSVEPHSEVGQIAAQYNRVLDAFHEKSTLAEQEAEIARHARSEAEIARDELAQKIKALDQFSRNAVGRERQMIDLKREINALCRRLGEPLRYSKAEEGPS